MDKSYRAYLAEFVGVFLLVFISGAACASLPADEHGQPRVDPWATLLAALAAGGTLGVVLPIVYRESPGCLNPVITLTLWVCKRLNSRQMGILIGLQLLGSLVAGLVLRALLPEFPDGHFAIRFATPHIGKWLYNDAGLISVMSLVIGIAVEGVLTFFLTFAVFGFLIDRRARRFDGIGVGVAQFLIVLGGYHLTGGAANPARWFGPAVWQMSVEPLRSQSPLYDHPVYWMGPILGAVAAGYIYTMYLLPPDQARGDVP